MRVVDAIATWLELAGMEHYFGIAGGAIWGLLDALVDKPELKGFQAKHESQAVHMADTYYRVTGRLAPVLVTKGPGLLNCVGGVANAMHDSIPLLLIGGAGSTHFFGKATMQEIFFHGHEDALSVFRPVTKGSWLVVRPDLVIDVLNQAYRVATSGRPGPVFVQVPYDVQLAEVEGEVEGPSRRSVSTRQRGDPSSLDRIASLLAKAERPLILAGGGTARSSGAPESLRTVAEKLNVPIVTTLVGKGVVSEEHELSLGPVGRSGTGCAAEATREADVIVAVGARFADNHAGNWRKGSIYDITKTKIVQVDLDPAEVGRNYPVEVGLLSDAKLFFDDLATATNGRRNGDGWVKQISVMRSRWREEITPVITSPTSPIHPGRLSYEAGEALPKNGRVYIDVGDVIQYAEPYMTIRTPGAWQINPGMAEMSWASSGVLGALAAEPDRAALVLTGDGAFNMTSSIVATAVEYALPAVWVILNNNEFGIERKGAFNAYKRVHPWMTFTRADTGQPYNPDFAALARAYGAEGERVETAEQFRPALERAFASGRPYIVDVPIDLGIPTYFTKGLDRAYPDKWGESYPSQGLLRLKTKA